MKYRVFVEKKAIKQLENADAHTRRIIEEKISKLKNGFPAYLDIKKLKGYRNYYRLRVGGYRILFELQPNYTIVVYAILPRRRAYK